MEKVVSATEARIKFGEITRRAVEQGEAVIVSRGGKPYVAIVPFAEYERLKTQEKAERWRKTSP